MFGACDHDATLVHDGLGGAPAAGFFAAGEIGPVGGRSFLHTFTATVAVFPQPATWPDAPRIAPRRRAPCCSPAPPAASATRSRGRWRRAGRELILTGRRRDVLERLAAELGGARDRAADLADRDDVQRLAAEAAPDVDVLVANAALPASGELTELTQEQIDRMLEVNLRAPIALARALAPGMIARGRGHLVFISSLSGKTASPASSLYSATKFGLRGFALGLREDLREHGVGVSVVVPGLHPRRRACSPTPASAAARRRHPHARADVAAAVIRAIEHNRAELDVAPLGAACRRGDRLGRPRRRRPRGSRLLGSQRIAARMAERQRDKR